VRHECTILKSFIYKYTFLLSVKLFTRVNYRQIISVEIISWTQFADLITSSVMIGV